MKVICINNIDGSFENLLTIGKEYDSFTFNIAHNYLRITDNSGENQIYPKDWFVTLEEYRNKRLEELGI